MILKCSFISSAILLLFLSVGCKSSSVKDHKKINHLEKSKDSLIQVKSVLYKDELTGVYYFKFRHFPTEDISENRFVPVLNSNEDTIKVINEMVFKKIFNFYVDDSYIFKVVDKYDQYEVHPQSIDSIPEGCYYENSKYRISNGGVEYYQGRAVSKCSKLVSTNVNISSDTLNLKVLDIDGFDCCVVNNKIFIDGCLLENFDLDNKTLRNKINDAINEGKIKHQYCYPENKKQRNK